MAQRLRINPFTIVLIVLGVVFVVIGIIYLTQTTNHLPGFIPGKPSAKVLSHKLCSVTGNKKPCFTPRHYTKRGIAGVGVGIVCFVGAFYTMGMGKSRSETTDTAGADA